MQSLPRALTLKAACLIAVAVVVASSSAPAVEAASSKESVSGLSIFVTLQRYRIRADHCSTLDPRVKPEFDGLMEGLASRIQGIAKGLLSSDGFKDMNDGPVPAEIAFAFADSLNDARQNVERKDAGSVCQKTLKLLGEMSDETLKEDLAQVLSAVRGMARNMEKESAREAHQ
jgi:hypothetical protein